MSITKTGNHAAEKVIHSLILLVAGRGDYSRTLQYNGYVCKILKIGIRTIDRIKKQFIEEGLDAALKIAPTSGVYDNLFDSEMEVHLVALASVGKRQKVIPSGHFDCWLTRGSN